MSARTEANAEPNAVLYRIKRGLAGYVSYLAACEMNHAFSEYVLYEPILRILTARGYVVNCEFQCPGLPRSSRGGDFKRIDFEVSGHNLRFVIEVKWARGATLNVRDDYRKLSAFHDHYPNSRSFLCVFGRRSHVQPITLSPSNFAERGEGVYADLGITKYGCRIYELRRTRPF